jgi:hypothetical protein
MTINPIKLEALFANLLKEARILRKRVDDTPNGPKTVNGQNALGQAAAKDNAAARIRDILEWQ